MADADIIDGKSKLITAGVGLEPATCGNCHFGHPFREGLQIVPNAVECYGVPPTPVIMGQGPQGAAVGLMRPRLNKAEQPCAVWRSKLAIQA